MYHETTITACESFIVGIQGRWCVVLLPSHLLQSVIKEFNLKGTLIWFKIKETFTVDQIQWSVYDCNSRQIHLKGNFTFDQSYSVEWGFSVNLLILIFQRHIFPWKRQQRKAVASMQKASDSLSIKGLYHFQWMFP